MYKYKVVRSFGPSSNGRNAELQEAFEEGYEFVRASEYIEGRSGYAGYIEYILRRKEKLEYDCFLPYGAECPYAEGKE